MAMASTSSSPPSPAQDLFCFVLIAFGVESVLHSFGVASALLDLLLLFLVVFIFRQTRTRFGFAHIYTAASFDADALEFAGRALHAACARRRSVDQDATTTTSHSRVFLAMISHTQTSTPAADEMIKAAADARIATAAKFHEETESTQPSSLMSIALFAGFVTFLAEAHASTFLLYCFLGTSAEAGARGEEESTGGGGDLDLIESLRRDLDSYAEILVAAVCFVLTAALFLISRPACFLCVALALWLILGIELAREASVRLSKRMTSSHTGEEDESPGYSSGHEQQLQEDDESISGWTLID